MAEVRSTLFAHLQTLPASFYARRRTGEIMSRVVNDLMLIRSLFGPGCSTSSTSRSCTPRGCDDGGHRPSPDHRGRPPLPFLLITIARSAGRSTSAATPQEQLAEIGNKAQENLSGINQVKAYVRETAEIAAFTRLSEEYRRRNLSLALSRGLTSR